MLLPVYLCSNVATCISVSSYDSKFLSGVVGVFLGLKKQQKTFIVTVSVCARACVLF